MALFITLPSLEERQLRIKEGFQDISLINVLLPVVLIHSLRSLQVLMVRLLFDVFLLAHLLISVFDD